MNLYLKFVDLFPGGGLLLRIIYSFECDKKAVIGENVKFLHRGLGTVISARAIIGDNTQIQHHVTLGVRHRDDRIFIGKNVYIGAYAQILGNVTIGDNAVIGAGAMVFHDIEPNATYISKYELTRIK